MLRYICVLSLCSWFAADALGVTVTINYLKRPTCTYSDGRLRATATGGVGPYTYLWNTGATTETITDVPAGAYSVTVTDFNSEEATANYNLVSLNYDLDEIFLGSFLGRCGEVDHLVLDTWYIPGPPPYFIDGQQVLEDPNGFYHPYIPSTSDTTYTFTFEDGNGCTGIIEDRVGWPYEFPEVTVLEVSGSCANDSSGQVVLDVSSEGHEQDILSFLYGNDNYWCGTQIHSIVRPCYDLPPGEYYLATTGPAVGPLFASRGCADTTWFTIPDLGPTCGSIHGRTHIDQVRDCENDWTEPGVSDQLLEILPGPYYTLSRAFDGSYGLQLPFGDYTVQQLGTVYEPYCQPDPIPFALMQGVPWAIQNFADTSTLVQGVEVDLQVMMACGAARPGFELEYAIHRKNLGPGASGTQVLTMTFDPTLGFLDATPAPTSIVGNTLTWNTGSMWGGSEAVTRIHFQVPPDIELLGTVLEGTATLATAQPDVDLTNNTVLHSVVITGAYDPNDKRARTSTGTSDSSYYVGDDDHIDYTIRFQNTGTDTAFHVVISDTIATNLDLRTFVAGASS
ncbi:MAG: SprB repeat-containing protein, partial [Flavobacteriales bacterium]|nr:SprB repeat-containing protein [Flavobacteriales bacterium]